MCTHIYVLLLWSRLHIMATMTTLDLGSSVPTLIIESTYLSFLLGEKRLDEVCLSCRFLFSDNSVLESNYLHILCLTLESSTTCSHSDLNIWW